MLLREGAGVNTRLVVFRGGVAGGVGADRSALLAGLFERARGPTGAVVAPL